ncbi:MAG TPA: 2-dehydropantoate 2-reductase N-terminal domain-containing protein [Propionibacteriaceae bacterium]
MSSRSSVLIVGAGATGLPLGYHLGLAGADVTFLVRRGRKGVLKGTQRLYCYDDALLKEFADYTVIDGVADLADRSFQFVIVTLDGLAATSPEGASMLRELGDAIRPTQATVIFGNFGFGLRDYYVDVMQLPPQRLLRCIPFMLSHQASAGLPPHPPTDPSRLAQASICYKHPPNKVGIRLESGSTAAARQFAALYNRCQVSRCVTMNPKLVEVGALSLFPVYLAGHIAGWPKVAPLVADKELWQLACRAQREIAALPQHGWFGRMTTLAMGPRATAKLHLKMERDMLPLDYQEFNRFHHGGKVQAQDVELLRSCLVDGQRQGQSMEALEALLARAELTVGPREPAVER